jgi:hypothetical protein
MEALNFRVVKFFSWRFGSWSPLRPLSPSIFIWRFGPLPLRLFLLFSFLSFYLFCCKSGPPPGMTDPGELIYFGYVNQQAQCSRCHGDEGQGGMFGPKIHGALQSSAPIACAPSLPTAKAKVTNACRDWQRN